MVRRQLLTVQSFGFPRHLNICQVNQKLELIVTVLNVNEGHNADLMQHCNTLNEYAQYVARVRHYASDMSLNHAVECAVDECIREGILAEFHTRNRNEVISMSIFEYDKRIGRKEIAESRI